MNLRHLECFFAVADELHFGRAAQRLHLSPASVSEAVSALERSLGVRLFNRTSRRVRLTPQGQDFLTSAREAYEQLARVYAIAKARGRTAAQVRIAHTPELGRLLMPRLQVALRELPDHAAGRWMPELMHTSEQLNCLADGRIDVGLCWDIDTVPGLRGFVLKHVPMVAVLGADDPLAEHSEISLARLRDRQVLVTPRRDNPFIDTRMRSAFSAVGRRRGGLVEVPRYDELALQVAASRRIGLHPGTIALTNRVPGIVFRRIAPPIHVMICVVVREAVADDPPLRLLVELLGQVAAELDVDAELA